MPLGQPWLSKPEQQITREIANEIVGTLLSESQIIDKYDLPQDIDVIDKLLDYNIEMCADCGWWCHSYELKLFGSVYMCDACYREDND